MNIEEQSTQDLSRPTTDRIEKTETWQEVWDKLMPKGKFELSLIMILVIVGAIFLAYMYYLNSHPSTCYYTQVNNNNGEFLANTIDQLSCIKPGTNEFLLCYRNDNGILALPFCTNTIVPNPLNTTNIKLNNIT